jgi:hypothetical protein
MVASRPQMQAWRYQAHEEMALAHQARYRAR